MFVFANIFNGMAEDTNTAAVVENLFAAPLPAAVDASLLPSLDVRAYRIEGNTILPLEKFNMLSNYTGRVDLPRIREGLDRLQSQYRDFGFTDVAVTLPEQQPTNGIVRIKITETPAGGESALAAGITNLFTAPDSNKPALEVRGYRIEGNAALPADQFSLLTNYVGGMNFARLRDGLGQLQMRYRDLGFPSISVTLPQQRLTNGVVVVKVVEGRLNNITVDENRYYSSNNIRRALPGLTTGILVNTKWFQPELDQANASQDRQIYPLISPGPDPGTSDLTLKVKDRLPLHGHVEINDKSSPGTPLLRTDSAVQYGNLWQREHQAGFDYNFSPQAMKPGDYLPGFYDQPMVASYSGYYRLPLGFGHGLREHYENLPVDFGYNEITHRFNLPPATGNPDIIFYASRSTSDTPVQFGPVTVITNTPLADISSQFAQRTLTINNNLGTKLTILLQDFLGVKSSLLLGLDYKSFQSQTFSTNLDYFNLYSIDTFGNRTLVTNEIVPLPANQNQKLYYLPISLGWVASRSDPSGSFTFNYNQSIFLAALASARSDFQAVANSSGAGGNYTTVNLGLSRQQNLPCDWSMLLRADGQWSSAPLIGNEQYALGGTGGVRGYQEGEAYGDTGWRTMFDLRAPPVNVGHFPTANGDIPAELRCSWFMDYGRVYLLDRPGPGRKHLSEWGTGLGFFLTAGEHFDARLTLAWALADAASRANQNNSLVISPQGSVQAYFSVGFQF